MIQRAVREKKLRAARVGGRRELRILHIPNGESWLRAWLESSAEPIIPENAPGVLRAAR
jgi:hypothetical protein